MKKTNLQYFFFYRIVSLFGYIESFVVDNQTMFRDNQTMFRDNQTIFCDNQTIFRDNMYRIHKFINPL